MGFNQIYQGGRATIFGRMLWAAPIRSSFEKVDNFAWVRRSMPNQQKWNSCSTDIVVPSVRSSFRPYVTYLLATKEAREPKDLWLGPFPTLKLSAYPPNIISSSLRRRTKSVLLNQKKTRSEQPFRTHLTIFYLSKYSASEWILYNFGVKVQDKNSHDIFVPARQWFLFYSVRK